jgi:hypothetical protein
MWLLIILILLFLWSKKEGFTGKEVYSQTGGKMDMEYDKFKNKTGGNIVHYHDFRALDKVGNFNPQEIDKSLKFLSPN